MNPAEFKRAGAARIPGVYLSDNRDTAILARVVNGATVYVTLKGAAGQLDVSTGSVGAFEKAFPILHEEYPVSRAAELYFRHGKVVGMTKPAEKLLLQLVENPKLQYNEQTLTLEANQSIKEKQMNQEVVVAKAAKKPAAKKVAAAKPAAKKVAAAKPAAKKVAAAKPAAKKVAAAKEGRTAPDAKLVVLNKDHQAREGSKRAEVLNVVLKTKTYAAAVEAATAAGGDASFVRYAVGAGLIEFK